MNTSYHNRNVIFSICGTSILTNGSSEEIRKGISAYANAKASDEVPEEFKKILETRFAEISEMLEKINVQKAVKCSAELHSIIKLYGQRPEKGSKDHHILICTDTWLGEVATKFVSQWLKDAGLNVDIYKQKDLQTKEWLSFQLSLSDLVKTIAEKCRIYKEAGYHIIFNLTGGFKSVQGFMQALAMIYADESVYVFESGDELLRIPRLPVQWNAGSEIKEHIFVFRRLGMKLPIRHGDIGSISGLFLFNIEGDYCFSAWGEVAWDQHRKEIYSEKLWPSPSKKIVYGPAFEKSLQKLSGNRLAEVNTKIDMLARHLEKGKDYNLKGLDFKPLAGNPVQGSTHELDAWHDQDAKRIFGHFDKDIFFLDKLDKALH